MPENTSDEPIKPIDDSTTIQPVPEMPAPMASDAMAQPLPNQPLPTQPDVLADVRHPVGSSYDPMPLQAQVDTSRNWLGVVALIFGIIGGSVIAIVLGIIGLNAVKQGKAQNRGMNIWGIILGVIWLVISIIASIFFWVFVSNASESTKIAVGDCFTSSIDAEGNIVDETPNFIACDSESNGRVYYIVNYTPKADAGTAELDEELYALCTSDSAVVGVNLELASEYWVEPYVLAPGLFSDSDAQVICGLSNSEGPVDPAAFTS